MDRSALKEAENQIKQLEAFVAEIEGHESEAAEKALDNLNYFLRLGQSHYRNLLHCYSIAEKKVFQGDKSESV